MKIYDITQPLFECRTFPGDIKPEKIPVSRIGDGAEYNLTNLLMCVHNGTHVDAPYHFINDGKGIDKVSLERFVGKAYVHTHEGSVGADDAREILARAEAADPEAWRKILIRGNAVITLEAAEVFADAGIDLIGNESQTVGPEDAPKAVHLALLGKDVVLLEGLSLSEVPDGVYFLNCAPLNLSDTDGAPCRALLFDFN